MKVLILGGSGFLGKHLIKSFSKNENVSIYTITRNAFEVDGVSEKYFGNILDVEFLKDSINEIEPQIVFYLISDFTQKKYDDLSTYLGNSTKRVENLTSVVNDKTRIVYVGSAAQYGNTEKLERKVVESDSFNPVSHYGLMKSFEEAQLKYFANKYKLNVVYTRIFNLIGPGEPSMTFSGSMVSQGLKKGHVNHGNLYPIRDFVDVRDAANALRIISKRGKKDSVYNICSSFGTKISDLLDIIIHNLGKEVTLEKNSDTTSREEIPKIVGCNKQLSKLGWIQRYSLENSVKDLIRYYLKYE